MPILTSSPVKPVDKPATDNILSALLEDATSSDPLSSLLDDAMAEHSAKLKETRRKQARGNLGSTDHIYEYWEEQDKYIVKFACAMFLKKVCGHCGSVSYEFSHFAEYQVWSKKIQSKPSRWQRVTERPEVLGKPRLIERVVDGCNTCVSLNGAVPFQKAEEVEERQLSLFNVKEN